MTACLLWFVGWVSAAFAATGDLCVDLNVDVVGLSGDRWIDNSVDKAARRARVLVESPSGQDWRWLGDDGCLWQISVPTGPFAVYVYSYARVSGVDLESWSGAADGPRDFEVILFPGLNASPGFSYGLTHTPTTPTQKSVWRNLLVAAMVFKDSDWNIDLGPSRACCHTGEQANGTCSTPANEYQPLSSAVRHWMAVRGRSRPMGIRT